MTRIIKADASDDMFSFLDREGIQVWRPLREMTAIELSFTTLKARRRLQTAGDCRG